jgi:hypothetical protein
MSRHRTGHERRSTRQETRGKKSIKKGKRQHHRPPQKLVAPTIALTVALTGPTVMAGEQEVLTAPEVEVREQRPGYIVPYLGLSRFPEPVRDIPQTINVVPQELMQQQADFSLQDALRNVTGISFQAGEGGGAQGNNTSSTPGSMSPRCAWTIASTIDLAYEICCATATLIVRPSSRRRVSAVIQPPTRHYRRLAWPQPIRGVTPRRASSTTS